MNSKQLTQYLSCLSKVQVGDWLEYYVRENGELSRTPSPFTDKARVKSIGTYYDRQIRRQNFPVMPGFGLYAIPGCVLIKRIIKRSSIQQAKDASLPNLSYDWSYDYEWSY
jgi:hypothetical protein